MILHWYEDKPIVLEKPNCELTNLFKSIVNLIEEHYRKKLQTKLG